MKKSKYRKWILLWGFLVLTGLLSICYTLYDSRMLGEVFDQVSPNSGYREMHDDSLYTVSFRSRTDTVQGIELFLEKMPAGNGKDIKVSLSQNNKKAAGWQISRSEVSDSETTYFPLEKALTNCKGDRISIEISSSGYTGVRIGVSSMDGTETPAYRLISDPLSKILVFFLLAGILILGSAIFAGFYLFRKKSFRTEQAFVTIYIILCLVSFLAIPVFNTPDEDHHFYRIYELSQGHLISDKQVTTENGQEVVQVGREFPKDLCPDDFETRDVSLWDVKNHLGDKVDSTETEFCEFANTALYAPPSYLPQIIGVKIADILTDSPLFMAYLGRLMNTVTFGLLVFFAIRLSPFGKNLIAITALLPMSIQAANSLSADGLAIGIVLLFVAYILYLKYTKTEVLHKKEIALLYLLIFFLCCCKIVYVPFCLLLFLIPQKRFKSRSAYKRHVVTAAVMIVVLSLGWLLIATSFLGGIKANVNVDTAKQIKGILKNPIQFVMTFVRTLKVYLKEYLLQFLGERMGWMNIYIPSFLLYPFLIILGVEVCMDQDTGKHVFPTYLRVFLGGTSILIFLLVFVTLYGQWTPVGYRLIEGIQGRYFIPLIFPFLLAVKPIRRIHAQQTGNKQIPWNSYTCVLILNLSVFLVLAVHVLADCI